MTSRLGTLVSHQITATNQCSRALLQWSIRFELCQRWSEILPPRSALRVGVLEREPRDMSVELAVFHGSCLCGEIGYEIRAKIRAVSHCHCQMCQKAHGAAFGSYGSVLLEHFKITRGPELVRSYQSSPGVVRTFCSACGSPLTWHQTEGEWASWISFSLGTLDTPFTPTKHRHVHEDSRPSWSPSRT